MQNLSIIKFNWKPSQFSALAYIFYVNAFVVMKLFM